MYCPVSPWARRAVVTAESQPRQRDAERTLELVPAMEDGQQRAYQAEIDVRLQQCAESRRGNTLAERGDHAAGNEDVSRHGPSR